MEHISLINRIIEAEQRAQEIFNAARSKHQNLQADLKGATEDIQKGYRERASRRIEEVRRQEDKHAVECIAELDERFARDLSAMEGTFATHRADWVNTLFSLIVGR